MIIFIKVYRFVLYFQKVKTIIESYRVFLNFSLKATEEILIKIITNRITDKLLNKYFLKIMII